VACIYLKVFVSYSFATTIHYICFLKSCISTGHASEQPVQVAVRSHMRTARSSCS